MIKLNLCYFIVFYVLLLTTAAVGQNCGDTSKNVFLEVSPSEDDKCPNQPVTARCRVRKPVDSSTHLLLWQCDDTSERVVLCNDNPALELACQFGTLYDIKSSCICDDTVIESEATFNTTSLCDMVLYCSNGEDIDGVSVSVTALETPVLSYEVASTRKDVQNVTLIWTTPDSSKTDMEYLLTLSSSANSQTTITKLTHYHLEVYPNDHYLVSVVSQRCSGNLKSNTSNTLPLFSDGPSSSTPESQVRTSDTKSSDRADPVVAVAGGSVAGGAVVAAVIVLSILVCCFCWRKRWQKEEEEEAERSGTLDADHAELYKGEELSDHQKEEIIVLKDDDTRKKSGVGGLFVEGGDVYYSCCEKFKNQPGEIYTLHKRNRDGRTLFIRGGFKHIRGVDKDNSNCYYVIDRRVLKFNGHWEPLRQTSSNSTDQGTVFSEPFGLAVIPDYVFVCAYRKKQICIFDHDLNLLYRIDHPYLVSGPIDVMFYHNRLFVTIKAGILVFEIDFKNKRFEVTKIERITMEDDRTEPFNPRLELRGICANHQFLYVAERNGRLLCLEFNSVDMELKYIDAIHRCSPYVVAHDSGTVYYSKRTKDGKFYIAKITHEVFTNKMKTEDVFPI